MAELVTAAEKGSKKAMSALFEANRDKAFGLSVLLLEDEIAAGEAVSDIFCKSFGKITVKGIYDDEAYAKYILLETASTAAERLFGNSGKTFRVSRSDAKEIYTEAKSYEGNLESGIKELKEALSGISPAEAFVFLLKSAGFSYAEISKIIVQRESAAFYFYCEAVNNLKGKVDLETAEDLVCRYVASKALPSENTAEVKTAIKNRARFELPSKRAMTAIIAGVCFIALALMAFFLFRHIYISKNSFENEPGSAYHVAAALSEDKTYFADIKIKDYGTITVKLDQKSAPNTAANFVELAEKGFYDGLTFHRIIEDFMMQGGCPDGNGMGDPGYSIKGEFSENGFEGNNILHDRGVISMARGNDKNSAGSQFFIMHKKTASLDGNYAAFGYVTEGLDIVDKICTEAEPTDDNGTIKKEDQPIIESITIRTE